MDLHIDRLSNRIHLAEGAEDREAWRLRIHACSRELLTRAINATLPGVMASLGLGPAAEVCITTLRVRLAISDGPSDDTEIASAWARAVTEALRAVIEPLARAGGGATEEVAVFPDRFLAEVEALSEILHGLPPPWWLAAMSATSSPSPSAVIQRWMEECPERAPMAVAELARSCPRGLDEIIGEHEAEALLTALVRARSEARRLLSVSSGAASDRGEIASPTRIAIAEHEEILFAEWLTLDETRIAARTRSPRAHALVSACHVLWRSPSIQTIELSSSDDAPEKADRSAQEVATFVEPDLGSTIATERAAPRAPELALTASPAASLRTLLAAREHRVDAGGLLFFVRRVAASSWPREYRGEALEQRLVALAVRLLNCVFAPLPEAQRVAAWLRQWPLVCVFAGTRQAEPSSSACREEATLLAELGTTDVSVLASADALRETIAVDVPHDVASFDDGVRALYGASGFPCSPGDPRQALAHLLLRPGRLAMSADRADLFLPARSIDVALRLGGWDIDPGFVPHLGRVIRFTYEEREP